MKNGKPINLEARLKRLEADVMEIKTLLSARQKPEEPWWKSIVGSQANDPIAAEVNRQIAETREKERRKARRARAKKKARAWGGDSWPSFWMPTTCRFCSSGSSRRPTSLSPD